ncbi:MFS transporter [Mucilaginibacter sp.]|uniref:MFS transporter n=1 Tax=Mucilaginibacter sp. TaxID=1882438 RepID=UPI0026084DBB|nr:MFS transporter [Mucilaginibacter sp.]
MNLRPSKSLTKDQTESGLKLVIADGMSAEAMVVFTSGTFLTAMAISLGATNFQLGLFAALPTFTTIFQLAAIWLVQRFNNRRVITALFNLLARLPVIAIGLIPFLFTTGTSIEVLFLLLFFQHIFGDIAGASWNAWVKDLVPEKQLGAFFSRRIRMAQTLNVTLSLATAFCIDYIKAHYPADEVITYNILFLIGGGFGLLSVGFLLRTPEPRATPINDRLLTLFIMPLRNKNFKNLLIFNSFWAFALNLATPFFSVYMLKTIGLPLSYVISLGILSQLSGILSYKLWGLYTDRFSNKTIISISAPLYIVCILLFAFTAMPSSELFRLGLLVIIYLVSGWSAAGTNLALSNIGLKLASKNEAIAYLSVKNMFVAFFSTIAPLIGGLLADFFATHQFNWNMQFISTNSVTNFTLVNLQGWNYFFIFGGLLAMLSLRFLGRVTEPGETAKARAVIHLRANLRKKLRKQLGREVADRVYLPAIIARRRSKKLLKQKRYSAFPVLPDKNLS